MLNGTVYLIKDKNNDSYKIGITKLNCQEKRLKILQTGNPNELELICSVNCEFPIRTEAMLHRHFKKYHLLNEWYELPNDEVIKFEETCKHYIELIDALKDNVFFAKNLK